MLVEMQMDAHNLAIMFGPTLVRPQDNSMTIMVKDMADQVRVVESIVVHVGAFINFFLFFLRLLN